MWSWIEFSGSVTPLPGNEATRARRASILPLSFLGMALLLAPKICCGFFGCGRDDAETAARAGDQVLQASVEAMAVSKWPCTASPWPGFPGEDPPMIKSATDF